MSVHIINRRKIMLKTENLQAINKKLNEQRVILFARMKENQELNRAEVLFKQDNADRAIISRNINRNSLLLKRIEQQIHDIHQALNRLETGTYGICLDCGQSIQPARLEIIPTASLCVKCQGIQENK
jgi:RNA polymerase-binding protein DksA